MATERGEVAAVLSEPRLLLPLAMGVLWAVWGSAPDSVIAFAVALAVAAVSVAIERGSRRAAARVAASDEPMALVRRGATAEEIPVREVALGDTILLRPGRRVPADARLTQALGLVVDETSIAGGAAADKEAPEEEDGSAPNDRRGEVFAGTVVVRGRGTAVVFAIGDAESGRPPIRATSPTPLRLAFAGLARRLGWFGLGVALVVSVLGLVLASQPGREMALAGLAIGFALTPAELPVLVAAALAAATERLMRDRVLVRRLSAVEEVGGVTIVANEIAGALTQRQLRVARFEPASMQQVMLELGALCSDAEPAAEGYLGDPIEVALLEAAGPGVDVAALRAARPLVAEFTYDETRKRMSVVYERDGEVRSAVRGTPEAVLRRCGWVAADHPRPLDEWDRERILSSAAAMAADGLRVVAFGMRPLSPSEISAEVAEYGLTFVGLVALEDPLRDGVADAVQACADAGVRMVVATGDHYQTARSVGRDIGLDVERVVSGTELDGMEGRDMAIVAAQVSMFARVTPAERLAIVGALQATGERVLATGDGADDAAWLQAADVGIAFGRDGTDAAHDAADMLVLDGDVSALVGTIRQGRLLVANVRKAVRSALATKLALAGALLLPVLLTLPVPLAAIQILVIGLAITLGATVAFVAEPPEDHLMREIPRDPGRPFLDGQAIGGIAVAAAGLFAAVSAAYLVTWYTHAGLARAQTVTFVAWLLGQALLLANLRTEREPVTRSGVLANRSALALAAAMVVLAIVSVLVPGVHDALRTTSITAWQWVLAIGCAGVGTCWPEVWKHARPRRPRVAPFAEASHP